MSENRSSNVLCIADGCRELATYTNGKYCVAHRRCLKCGQPCGGGGDPDKVCQPRGTCASLESDFKHLAPRSSEVQAEGWTEHQPARGLKPKVEDTCDHGVSLSRSCPWCPSPESLREASSDDEISAADLARARRIISAAREKQNAGGVALDEAARVFAEIRNEPRTQEASVSFRERLRAVIDDEAKRVGEDALGAFCREGWFDAIRFMKWINGASGAELFPDGGPDQRSDNPMVPLQDVLDICEKERVYWNRRCTGGDLPPSDHDASDGWAAAENIAGLVLKLNTSPTQVLEEALVRGARERASALPRTRPGAFRNSKSKSK